MDNLFSFHQEKLLELPSLKTSNGSKITTIICLFSKSSPASREFIQSIPSHLTNYIYLLSIDNKILRNKILQSKNIEIKELPCIIVADTTTTISIFENENIKNIIVALSTNHNMLSNNESNNETTFISELPQPKKTNTEIENTNEIEQDNIVYPEFGVRKKTKLNKNSIHPSMERYSSAISNPKKGQYHDKMAKSSLNIGVKDNIETIDNVELIDDKDEKNNELASIRDEFELGNSSKKSEHRIKSMASIMENERNESLSLDNKL